MKTIQDLSQKEYQRQWYVKNKERQKKHNQEYYSQNKEKILSKNKEYYERNKEPIREYRASWRNANKKSCSKYYASYRKANPEKKNAHMAVLAAINSGLLKKDACLFCGNDKAEAHHGSYEPDKHLDVLWLCRFHHKAVHVMQKKIEKLLAT